MRQLAKGALPQTGFVVVTMVSCLTSCSCALQLMLAGRCFMRVNLEISERHLQAVLCCACEQHIVLTDAALQATTFVVLAAWRAVLAAAWPAKVSTRVCRRIDAILRCLSLSVAETQAPMVCCHCVSVVPAGTTRGCALCCLQAWQPAGIPAAARGADQALVMSKGFAA